MRIGIDCRAFQHLSRYLGIGTYSANLLKALAQANGHHEFIPYAYGRKQDGDGMGSTLRHFVEHPGFRITGRRSLLNQLRVHRVDLCHVLEFTPPFAPTDRTVATVYDLIPLIFPKVYLPWRHPRSRWGFQSYYRFLKQARRIIAISHHTKADLMRVLGIPPERVVVIYAGVSSSFRPLADPQRLTSVVARHRIRTPFALYVGSCDWRKNVPGLLAAFAVFRERLGKEFHLVLVGKDIACKAARLRQLGEALGIGPFLHLVGYVPLEDLVALYNAATMLVYPSLYEGFGFPPLEAMACGTPVLTSNNSSLAEVAGDAALLVDPYDEKVLAHGMCRLARDDLLRETLIQRGIRRARRFTWEEAARQTLRVYEALT